MTEQELIEKLNQVVSMAQEKILALLTDLHNEQAIAKAQAIFSSCPIVLETIDVQRNEFGKTTQVGGYATPNSIVISQNDIQKLNLNEQQALDNALGTIIHEYAHKFRQVDSKYGEMFEEASASIFAEMCVNYSKVKNNEPNNELFNMLTSVDYQKAESQVRGILYTLKQRNMDISMMTEYILGDENKFKQVCTQLFGNSFENYFTQANSTSIHQQNTSVSEKLITQILTDYAKNNQLSYKDYWASGKNLASATNLYYNGSPVLVQSVVNAGIGAIREDEKDLYRTFEYTAKVNQEQSQFIDDEKRTRIKDKLNQEFNLSGKSKDEIYDSLVDICSTYIQNKASDSEESIIYVEELKKIIPNIEEFADTFRQLRVSRLDSTILENMDLSNISFNQISDKMSSLMPKSQTEDVEKDFIATRDPNEVAKIHSNPQYASWRFEYIDGEYRFYSPNYKKTTEETYVTLEQLESMFSEPGYSYFGHGTGRKGNSDEPVNSIFKEGLRTKDNTLYYTAVGLDVPTPEYIQKCQELGMDIPTIDGLKQKLNNWGHEDSKKIIIIRLPDEFINYAGERSDLDGEMYGAFYNEHKQENGKVNYYLDSKFIVGCYDADKQSVRLNKEFERTLTPETIEQLKEKYKKTVEKTNARKERQTMGITQEEINLAQQQNQEPVVNYNADTYDSFDFDDNIEWEDTPLEQNISQEDQINLLKTQIAAYNGEIEMLLASMQPYMQIPKVNQEISKVIEKNNEINSSQIVDSLNDYKRVVEIKQTLVSYLEKADKFIKDNVGKKQEPVTQPQTQVKQDNTQSLPDDFWSEFEQPQHEQRTQQPLPVNFWDEFDKPDPSVRPERVYNDDGTYTMEYIAHLANTPLGFNQDIYDQLMQENELKRQQNGEQMSSGGRHM